MSESQEPEIDLTPMIDVTFLLIIFFMVVSDMSALDVEELELPYGDRAYKPEVGASTDDSPTLIINVLPKNAFQARGQIRIRGTNYRTLDGTRGDMTLAEFLKLEAEAVGREPPPSHRSA